MEAPGKREASDEAREWLRRRVRWERVMDRLSEDEDRRNAPKAVAVRAAGRAPIGIPRPAR